MELENTQNNALAKLPMLKLREYEMWEIRIKQYFQIQDYALWEVIENGNSWVPIPVTTPSETGTSIATKMTMPSTTEEKTQCLLQLKLDLEGMINKEDTEGWVLKQQYENVSASKLRIIDSISLTLQQSLDELVLLSQQLVLLEENSSYCSRLQLPVLNQSVNTARITAVGEKVNAAESLLVVSTEVNAN
ncbi:hypothetical protein Tco_0832126 [Tanacetum coccineum]